MKKIISWVLILALVISLCACSFGGTVTTDPTLDTTMPAGSTSTGQTATTQNQNSVPPSQRGSIIPQCLK